MSARVFNPLFMSEMLRGGGNPGPGGASAPSCGAELASADPGATAAAAASRPVGVESVRRQLFGPVDHEESRRFVKRELSQQQTRLSHKYNFDFARGRPLKGKLAWEKVTATDSVPEPYALRRLPFLTHHAEAEDSPQEDASTAAPAEEATPAQPQANNNNHVTKQKQMTDYMKSRKRLENPAVTKASNPPDSPAVKLARKSHS